MTDLAASATAYLEATTDMVTLNLDPEEIEQTRQGLVLVLAAVDAGEMDADPEQRAYLAGAVDTLARLTGAHD